jgi:hypothetical protein
METETDSPQPTHPVREGRTRGPLVAVLNLLLNVALLVSLFAAWGFIPIASTPAVCVFHHKPWWINLTEGSAWILIPTAIALGIVAVRSSKQAYRALLLSVGILNIVLGVLLILSLMWAEFMYFVCQL